MGQIFDDLLIKARRDKSKLVQVQRSVSRNGKTFMQNFWVSPNQVKSTDKVIGGQQNLLPQPGSVAKPASGVLDKAYFDSIKSDRTKALDYLKSCGVTWNDHSHAGINWMRANQAFTAALAVQGGQKIAPQGKSQATPKNQPSAQNSASGSQSKSVVLTSAQQAEVDAGKNGKEKVVILKKLLGKDGCMQYAKQLGVQWDEHSFDAINNMRMSMALTKHFDVADGIVSPTGGKAGKGGGAPKGNQNAKKDNSQAQQPTLPDDKIEIPANAKEREKNIINLINGITDEKTLDLIVKSGFVPEDDNAKEFIEKTLYSEYDKIIVKKSSRGSNNNYPYYSDDYSGFATDVSEVTTKMFKGLPKKVIKTAVKRSYFVGDTMMLQMTSPRETFEVINNARHNNPVSGSDDTSRVSGIFELCSQFSVYDDTNYSGVGYSGEDLSISEKQYSSEKDGFIRVLSHISDTQPELKGEAENMKKDYEKLMKLCNYNHKKLAGILMTDYETFKTKHDNQLAKVESVGILKDLLQTSGFSQSEIEATLTAEEYDANRSIRNGKLRIKSSSFYGDYKKDSSGNTVEVDISQLKTSDGLNLTDVFEQSSYYEYAGMKNAYKGVKNIYTNEVSESDYNEIVDTAFRLFGTKVVDSTTKLPPSLSHSQRKSYDNSDLIYVPDGDNPEKDAILMNLITIGKGVVLKNKINDNVDMCPPSAANNNGNDYTGNFNYYSNRATGFPAYRFSSKSDEIDCINTQLSQTKTYSLEYSKNLKKYVENNGDSTYQQSYWSNYKTPEAAKAASVSLCSTKITSDSFGKNSTPATDLFLDQLADTAQYCPQNFGARTPDAEKVKTTVRKKMGHEPYKFVDSQQLSAPMAQLKQLRENAFKKANCSLAFTDPQKRQDIEHEVKINFDKVDANGKRVPKPDRNYDNRALVFHSGVYEIKNSAMIEDFEKESQRMGETPKHMYHGTSYSAACGINGVDGRFRYKESDRTGGQKRSGSMLGEGIYVAKLIGKCCPYIGSDPYTYTSYTANDTTTPNNCADGVLIVCDTVLGKYGEFNDSNEARRNNKNNGGSYDSVAVGAGALMPGGGRLKEYECIVTRQNMVAPRYLVDVGARRR